MPDIIAWTMPTCAASMPSCSDTEGILVVPIASVTRRARPAKNAIFTDSRICA